MCGIVGVIGHNTCQPEQLLNQIKHRGPDSQGWFEDKNIFLGQTRLSIQDLSENGNQPMYSNDGRYVIIFNGEVYNHLEIREELNIDFKSTSDTETILYAYIKYGESFLNKLNGIFALAIYDSQKNEIFLAKDQLGVKPLYYYRDEEKFLFSSEIKSFLNFNIDKEISIKAISNYLTFLWSPGPDTPFKNVEKLLPGHCMKFKLADFKTAKPTKYYQIPFNGEYLAQTEEELIDKLEEKLLKAVKRQMLSDVPVGFFLSGGLDSSLLVAMAKKIYPEKHLSCFTIDTETQNGSEGFTDDLPYARKVAAHLNVELNIVKADVNIFRDFDKMIWHLDEPQADSAPLNVLNICRFAREKGIKVLIGGTGGDDLFSGYRRHKALNFEKYFKKTPALFARFIVNIIGIFRYDNPFLRRIKKLTHNINQTPLSRMAGYFSWIPYDLLQSLFKVDKRANLDRTDPVNQLIELNNDIPNEKSLLNQMLYWELKSFLVDHNLNYTDKLAMAVGVEARVPYLDLELVEFSTKIPPSLKMKGNETKYILKKVAEKYLPMDVIYRPKTGFGAPIRTWILNDLEPMIAERLSRKKIISRGIFDPDAIWKLIEDNKAGKVDASYIILSLLAIESWMNQFLDNPGIT